MITDKQLDETLVELLRTKRALEALRAARKTIKSAGSTKHHQLTGRWSDVAESGAARRASLDLTRALSKLRKGDV